MLLKMLPGSAHAPFDDGEGDGGGADGANFAASFLKDFRSIGLGGDVKPAGGSFGTVGGWPCWSPAADGSTGGIVGCLYLRARGGVEAAEAAGSSVGGSGSFRSWSAALQKLRIPFTAASLLNGVPSPIKMVK